MPADVPPNLALDDGAARQLANVTKTTAPMATISPRWLVRFMDWDPVGHHCAQPILRRFGLESTVRPSLALYNTREEIDLLVSTLHRLARGTTNALTVRSRTT